MGLVMMKTIAIASLLFAAACSTSESGQPEEAPTCATTTCDPNATCAEPDGAPVCSCKAGFTGDGETCADVNECTTAANTCAAGNACVNAPGGFDCLPTSCAGVHAADPMADDGTYTLYVGGDPAKPWDAFCADMQASTGPVDYLPLENVLGDHNFASYAAGGASPGTTVKTSYIRLRINPATLVVQIGDQRFAASSGGLSHSGAGSVTSMPFGVAMSCDGNPGSANIDLRGTSFAVSDSFAGGGNFIDSLVNTSIDPDKQFIDLIGGGLCGWNGGSGTPYNPFNDAQGTLKLTYVQ